MVREPTPGYRPYRTAETAVTITLPRLQAGSQNWTKTNKQLPSKTIIGEELLRLGWTTHLPKLLLQCFPHPPHNPQLHLLLVTRGFTALIFINF